MSIYQGSKKITGCIPKISELVKRILDIDTVKLPQKADKEYVDTHRTYTLTHQRDKKITNKYDGFTTEIGTNQKSWSNPYVLKGIKVPNSEIELFSLPNGVKDSYDESTNILTKRINKITLDCIDESDMDKWEVFNEGTGKEYFSYTLIDGAKPNKESNSVNLLSNTLIYQPLDKIADAECMSIDKTGNKIYLRLDEINSLEILKMCLDCFPITILYEYAEPKKIRIIPSVFQHTLSDLPTGQGIYQCQFIAQADYNEGDVFVKPTRNLIEKFSPKTITSNGITFTLNVDGSITAKGTTTGQGAWFELSRFVPSLFEENSEYTISLAGNKNLKFDIVEKGTKTRLSTNKSTAFKPVNVENFYSTNLLQISFWGNVGTVIDETVYPMLNKGDVALPYEPYGYNLPLTAKPTGEEQSLPDKAFVKGDLVNVIVDTANKKLNFNNVVNVSKFTYAELNVLKQNNQLVIGRNYLLTDYVTKYQQPISLTMKIGKYDLDTATQEQIQEETEPLLLTAISNNEFAAECYSPIFPNDIIYYDFDNNICEDGKTPRNGFITRRYWIKNEVNMPNDWRHIVWARYKVDVTGIPVWIAGTTVEINKYYIVGNDIVKTTGTGTPISATDNDYFSCVVIEDYADNYILFDDTLNLKADKTQKKEYYTCSDVNGKSVEYCNSINIISTSSDETHSNILGNNVFRDLTDDKPVRRINAEGYFVHNTLIGNNYVISFENDCEKNIFKGNNFNISFGNSCYRNMFGYNSRNISLKNACFRNIIGYNSQGISFENTCYDNILGSENYVISFGNNCFHNTLGKYCQMITFFDNCSYNTFGQRFYRLFIKLLVSKDISSISDLKKKIYTTTIEQMSNGKYCYWYKTGTNPTDVTTVEIP